MNLFCFNNSVCSNQNQRGALTAIFGVFLVLKDKGNTTT